MRIKRWPIKKMKSNPITLYGKSLFKKWCKGVFNSEVRVMLNIFFLHRNIRLNQFLVMPHQTGNWYSRWSPNKPTFCINFLPPFAHILFCFPQRSATQVTNSSGVMALASAKYDLLHAQTMVLSELLAPKTPTTFNLLKIIYRRF